MLKKANEKDIELIRELAKNSWESAYKNILSKEQIDYMLGNMYSSKEIQNHLNNPFYHYFLIFDGEIPVGFMGFEHHYEFNATKLHRIYLVEAAKGKGLGKSAMNFLKEETKKAGDQKIILNVNKNNPSKQIYEKQGFRIYEEGIFDIGNGYVMDDYLMEILV